MGRYRYRHSHGIGGIIVFIILAYLAFKVISFLFPLILTIGILVGIFFLVRVALGAYKPQRPNYYQPTQTPYQSTSYQQPYQAPQQSAYDPYQAPQQSYDQGYQQPSTPTYQPGAQSGQYQYPPSQYEQPQAQYPQEMPPQQ